MTARRPRTAPRVSRSPAVAWVALAFLAPAPLPAGEREDFDRVLTAWAARRADTRTLSAEFAGRTAELAGNLNAVKDLLPGPTSAGDYPPTDHEFDKRMTLLLDPARRRVRVELEHEIFNIGQEESGFLPETRVKLWDGAGWQVHHPRNGYPAGGASGKTDDLVFGTTPYLSLGVDPAALPVFFHAGYFEREFQGKAFGPGAAPAAPRYRSAGYVERDGRQLLVVRTLPEGRGRKFQEYWADPSRGGVVGRFAVQDHRGTLLEGDVEHERDAADAWRPVRWRVTRYDPGFDRVPVRTDELSLVTLERGVAVTAGDFRLEPQPGWWVNNRDAGAREGSVRYVYNGSDEPPGSIAAAIARRDRPDRGRIWWWAVAAAAAAAAGFLLLRRTRRAGV